MSLLEVGCKESHVHCSGDARYAGIHSSYLSAVGAFSSIIKGGGGVCVPSLIGHLASVDIKQHERKESMCERERIQLTDIESSFFLCSIYHLFKVENTDCVLVGVLLPRHKTFHC